jgi:hypothetical protein
VSLQGSYLERKIGRNTPKHKISAKKRRQNILHSPKQAFVSIQYRTKAKEKSQPKSPDTPAKFHKQGNEARKIRIKNRANRKSSQKGNSAESKRRIAI